MSPTPPTHPAAAEDHQESRPVTEEYSLPKPERQEVQARLLMVVSHGCYYYY